MTESMLLNRAMQNPDELVVEMEYTDSKGKTTSRVVSPIRILGKQRLLALCLCREEPRQFYLRRCTNLRLRQAADIMMPVPIKM